MFLEAWNQKEAQLSLDTTDLFLLDIHREIDREERKGQEGRKVRQIKYRRENRINVIHSSV